MASLKKGNFFMRRKATCSLSAFVGYIVCTLILEHRSFVNSFLLLPVNFFSSSALFTAGENWGQKENRIFAISLLPLLHLKSMESYKGLLGCAYAAFTCKILRLFIVGMKLVVMSNRSKGLTRTTDFEKCSSKITCLSLVYCSYVKRECGRPVNPHFH